MTENLTTIYCQEIQFLGLKAYLHIHDHTTHIQIFRKLNLQITNRYKLLNYSSLDKEQNVFIYYLGIS